MKALTSDVGIRMLCNELDCTAEELYQSLGEGELCELFDTGSVTIVLRDGTRLEMALQFVKH